MALEREITAEEKALAEKKMEFYDSLSLKLTKCLDIIVIRFSASLYFSVMAWILLAWIYSFFSDVEIGFTSDYQRPVFMSLIVMCTVYAISLCAQWLNHMRKDKQYLRDRLNHGIVTEESHKIIEVKQFDSNAYQCFVYFLLTSESSILVIYDSYNQGYKPVKALLESGYQIHETIKLVRLPQTWITIKIEFSGDRLPLVQEKFKMNQLPELWPSDSGFCEIPWDNLEYHFTAKNNKA